VTVLSAIQDILDAERFGSVVTVIGGNEVGSKAVLDSVGTLVAGSLPQGFEADITEDALAVMGNEQHRALEYGDISVFVETLAPPQDLLIFGAVHIGQSLALFASQMGYRVTVVDARAAFATKERFPTARRVLVGWPEDLLDQITFDSRTWVVVLAHDQRHEDPVLDTALKSNARFIGAMGSRRTHDLRLQRLRDRGFGEDDIGRVKGPVGLDIGAETPQEVAVSILAEMTMLRYGAGTGIPLHGRPGRIHGQRPEDG
jgi:xanthine dehydrogenase accessory factor